jgi:hypothetical protein
MLRTCHSPTCPAAGRWVGRPGTREAGLTSHAGQQEKDDRKQRHLPHFQSEHRIVVRMGFAKNRSDLSSKLSH